jgi:hypothetical protein
MENLRLSYSKNPPNRRFDMKLHSVVLFGLTGNNPAPSSAKAAVAVTSLELRVNASSRSLLSAGEKRDLAALQEDCREGEFWESVIFGTLGMCGAASTVLALLRMAADR